MPLNAVKTLLKIALAQGYSTETLIEHCGLNFNPLEENHNQTMVCDTVPTLIYSKLYKKVMEILQDESFGLNAYSKSPPGTFRMMCLFIIHAKNLAQALSRSAEFFDYVDSFSHNNEASRKPVSIDPQNHTALCRFEKPLQSPADSNIQADASILYMMHRLFSWLIGKPIELSEVCFIGPQPSSQQNYRQLFPCPVRFSQSGNILKFPARYLDAPIVQTEETLKDFLRTAPYQLVSTRSENENDALTAKVRQCLAEDLHQECPGIEDIATRLHVSSRTIHRKLQKEGTSFQKLKDQVRQEAAINYLARPELTVNAIAMLMGFHDTSAFYRAFKKWTGQSPGEYRKKHQ